MALYWVFELIPLGVTSIVPVILFPLLGILDTSTVSSNYWSVSVRLSVKQFYSNHAASNNNLGKLTACSM
jgi:solute carrier family 13 (sodium-dependent dicarboxylate transporter), member 2/3/5